MTLPAPVNQVVAFNFVDWAGMYPELGSVTAGQAQGYFNQATLYCDNTPTSPVQDPYTLTIMLYLLTAHIAKLFAMLNGQAPSGLVGQINTAAEGSVSVGTVYVTPTGDMQAWTAQTQYGASFWAMTARFRVGFYRPNPNNPPNLPLVGGALPLPITVWPPR